MSEAELMPDAERLKELLVGKKVVSIETVDDVPGGYYSNGLPPTGVVTLSDGTVLKLYGHDGGCACNSGCYQLTELNGCDNIITNVEVYEDPDDDYEGGEGVYRIFVFADNRKINLAAFEGTDGNGYYGTGWWLEVSA